MNVSPHFQNQYQRFQTWFNNQPGFTSMMIRYGERHIPNPNILNPEVLLFEAFLRGWMAREAEQNPTNPHNPPTPRQ